MNTFSYHSKIGSTQNKRVRFLFCLGHGIQCYFLMQALKQEFFKIGEVSWNWGTSINISSKTLKRTALLGKILEYFLQDTVKTTLRTKNLTQRWTQRRPFFQNQGTFFDFLKKFVLCFSGSPYTLFTKMLLLFCISLLKRFICRRVNTSQILLAGNNPCHA